MADNAPLSGIKVIDLTRYLAGPFCTQLLGDYGAEVLKIEPVRGARAELGDRAARDSYFFLSTNRSKKSVQIDIKSPAGRALLMRLADSADVMVDNFRPGVIDAMGFGYADLAARNPRIIGCSISGFGSTGPLRDFPGFDQIAQGMSGLMSVTGTADSGPMRVGIAICDLLAGIFAAQGILLALEARHRTGRGQRVETSLLESIVSILSWSAGIYFDTGRTPAPNGNHHPLSSPHGVFEASDRPFNIAVGNEAMWAKFVIAIGRAELAFRRSLQDRSAPDSESRGVERANQWRAEGAARRLLDRPLQSRRNSVGTDPDGRRDVQASADCGARDAADARPSGARNVHDHRTADQTVGHARRDRAATIGGRAYACRCYGLTASTPRKSSVCGRRERLGRRAFGATTRRNIRRCVGRARRRIRDRKRKILAASASGDLGVAGVLRLFSLFPCERTTI